MKAKIVIIGGGVMGLSIAAQAARKTDALSDPVMLLERDSVGSGASGQSSANLRQFSSSRTTAGMARDSLKYFAGFESKTGRSIGFLRSGVLTLCASRRPEDIARMEELVAMQASIGIDTSVVDASEIRELVHGIEVEDGTLGAWESGAGTVDAERTLEALSALARNKGAVIRAGTLVEEVLVKDGRVCGVRTSDGEVTCDQVVLAAGPWSGRLLAQLGLPYPLEVARTEFLHVCSSDPKAAEEYEDPKFSMHGPEESGATSWLSRESLHEALTEHEPGAKGAEGQRSASVAHPVLIDPQVGLYIRCDPLHRRARVGRYGLDSLSVQDDPDQPISDVPSAFRDWATTTLARRIPSYQGVRELDAEAGLYSMTPDARAMIGPLPEVEGLYLVSGFSGYGFKLAPSVGEGVAQMLFGEPVSAFEPELFAPARFASAEASSRVWSPVP